MNCYIWDSLSLFITQSSVRVEYFIRKKYIIAIQSHFNTRTKMKVLLLANNSSHYDIPVSMLSGSVCGSDPDPVGPETK